MSFLEGAVFSNPYSQARLPSVATSVDSQKVNPFVLPALK